MTKTLIEKVAEERNKIHNIRRKIPSGVSQELIDEWMRGTEILKNEAAIRAVLKEMLNFDNPNYDKRREIAGLIEFMCDCDLKNQPRTSIEIGPEIAGDIFRVMVEQFAKENRIEL